MSDGKIVEEGTYKELMGNEHIFYNLVASSKGWSIQHKW